MRFFTRRQNTQQQQLQWQYQCSAVWRDREVIHRGRLYNRRKLFMMMMIIFFDTPVVALKSSGWIADPNEKTYFSECIGIKVLLQNITLIRTFQTWG